MRIVDMTPTPLVCGYVNAKNRMGGYVGKKLLLYRNQDLGPVIIGGHQDAYNYRSLIALCEPTRFIPRSESEGRLMDEVERRR
jgi:hypothetical protein